MHGAVCGLVKHLCWCPVKGVHQALVYNALYVQEALAVLDPGGFIHLGRAWWALANELPQLQRALPWHSPCLSPHRCCRAPYRTEQPNPSTAVQAEK